MLEAKIALLRKEFDSVQEQLNKSYLEDEMKEEMLQNKSLQKNQKQAN